MKNHLWILPAFTAIILVSCNGAKDGDALSGEIKIDGSSTVYPITEAVTEEFIQEYPRVRITVGVSGTGGGFDKFCRGEIEISNASRSIKPSEVQQCNQQNIEYVELSVAYDGMAVLVHPDNDWVDHLTVEELKKIWRPEAQDEVTRWNQIRPEWPDEEIHLFGPGVASGTYDYFTEAVVGESGKSRGDFTASEDDNVLVQGISTDKYSLGFFGFAYYEENQNKLKLVPIDNGNGPVTPSIQTVKEGTYAPLSRPIFIYVKKEATKAPEVNKYVTFYLQNAPELTKQVGYIPMTDEEYQQELEKFRSFSVGGDAAENNDSTKVE
jgi:phosphate transport system substrate-binding protein